MAESKKKGYFRTLPNTRTITMEKIQINSFVVNQKQEKHIPLPLFMNNDEEKKQESFEDLKRDGMKEAEAGNFGKALSLLSHAADINAQDYKVFEMIAQIHLIQGRPFGAIKFAMRSIGLKPDWCEGYITLARAQREMGEVHMAIDSYKKAISLLDTAESLSEEEKKEIQKEARELETLLTNYNSEHGELQGRAHVVADLNALGKDYADYSSMREIWKEEIKNSEIELEERREHPETTHPDNQDNQDMDVEPTCPVCYH